MSTAAKAPKDLHDAGQSLWLDYITREIVNDGTLKRYIDELSLTGLTSNPTIFDKALRGGDDYDEQIAELLADGKERRGALLRARDHRPARRRRPLPAESTTAPTASTASSRSRSRRCSPTTPPRRPSRPATCTPAADRPNLYIKIPGTPQGLDSITESIAAGIPINVTLLFDADQYRAQADAYMKGIERRVERGEDPAIESVASVFVSRWDVAVADKVPAELKDRLGVAARSAPTSPTASCSTPIAGSGSRTRARGRSGCCSPPPGPRIPDAAEDEVRRRARRAEHRQHDARGDAAGARRAGRDRRPAAGRRRRQRVAARRVRPRPASTSTRSPTQLQVEGAEKFENSWTDLLECIAGKESTVGSAG